MTEFLKKLTDKLFDFFNFGRIITIALPGLLIAIAITMFVSQLLFPHAQPSMVGKTVVATKQADLMDRPGWSEKTPLTVKKGESLTIIGEDSGWYQVELLQKSQGKVKVKQKFQPKLKDGETLTITDEKSGAYLVELVSKSRTKFQFEGIAVTPKIGDRLTLIDTADKGYQAELISKCQGWIHANTVDKPTSPGGPLVFRNQLTDDFGRLRQHYLLVALLSMVFGFMNYELAYRVLMCRWFEQPEQAQLYRYSPANDAGTNAAGKFKFMSKARLVGLEHVFPAGEPVGLVYFAPFLKEKFSGEENYFTFLITEFYRFVEASIVIPLALIQSSIFGMTYCWLFWTRHHVGLYPLQFTLLGIVGLSVIFLACVSTRIVKTYYKASHDLIQGVSDFMSKDLAKKPGG